MRHGIVPVNRRLPEEVIAGVGNGPTSSTPVQVSK